MTTKDLRLSYKAGINNAPFTDQLKIVIKPDNKEDVILYIQYLENELLDYMERPEILDEQTVIEK